MENSKRNIYYEIDKMSAKDIIRLEREVRSKYHIISKRISNGIMVFRVQHKSNCVPKGELRIVKYTKAIDANWMY